MQKKVMFLFQLMNLTTVPATRLCGALMLKIVWGPCTIQYNEKKLVPQITFGRSLILDKMYGPKFLKLQALYCLSSNIVMLVILSSSYF